MLKTLSTQQARKIVLHSQLLPSGERRGRAKAATLAAIEHLAYVQIDTISVIQRAHHHTLWNRNPRYRPDQLTQLVADKQVFEYWSHASAYLPMRDFRFSLHRKNAYTSGVQNHWYSRNLKLMHYVLDRIRAEGPLMAKDFKHTGIKTADWSSKPAKQALENLFMQGDLMISHRNNFHKVYDLSERVLPPQLNTTPPTTREYTRFLIIRFLQANGIGLATEFAYLLKNIKSQLVITLKQMLTDGELQQVRVAEADYYLLPESLALLDRPLLRSRLKILSPFDNLLIQRKRMRALFDFDYQIECYVPVAKRKFGYFALPILWDGQLVARMDCKVDRKTQVLHVHRIALELQMKNKEAFAVAFIKELNLFMLFNESKDVVIHRVSDKVLEQLLSIGIISKVT